LLNFSIFHAQRLHQPINVQPLFANKYLNKLIPNGVDFSSDEVFNNGK
jgi:hypothetical protein